MEQIEQNNEIKHLANILAEIKSQHVSGAQSHNKYLTDLNESLTDYWKNHTTDFWEEAQFIESLNRQRSIATASYRRYRQLEKLLETPYFARIDFMETEPRPAATAEAIYIGLATLADHITKELLIYDWRSPIAGMFYDFECGKASYEAPSGTISGKIILKRQFKIVQGRMEYMFDSDLKIDDEILQEILSKSTDSKMRTIITSIQREQNQAIRDEQHRILFVQGPAGSGKTSIAMHRAAYLLYRERNTINAKNILVFSPNRIFSDYISNVLPELGEENVQQTIFQDYLLRVLSHLPYEIEDRDTQLEYLYRKSTQPDYYHRAASIHYKSSPSFTKIIINYILEIQHEIKNYPDIVFNKTTIFTQAEWSTLFNHTLSYLPISKRLAQLRRMIQQRLRPIINQMRKNEAAKIAASGEEVNKKVIKALARLTVKKQMAGFIAELDQRLTIDPITLYRRLFQDQSLFKQLTTDIPAHWEDICRLTSSTLNQGKIFYEDSLPLLFFQGCLMGFPTRNEIRHLLVDEAQDYTLLQYEILKRLFPKSSWTILGDPEQSIHPYLQTATFESAAEILAIENTNDTLRPIVIRLTQSYRSTSEIQSFTRQLLKNSETKEGVERSGPLPQIVHIKSPEMIVKAITETIDELQREGWKSLAIICKTLNEAKNIHQKLKTLIEATLMTPETIEFKRGIVVVPAYLAKGLEFDGVLVYNANSHAYSSDAERNILYTVCTRALHRLILYYHDELTPFIQEINPQSYEKSMFN